MSWLAAYKLINIRLTGLTNLELLTDWLVYLAVSQSNQPAGLMTTLVGLRSLHRHHPIVDVEYWTNVRICFRWSSDDENNLNDPKYHLGKGVLAYLISYNHNRIGKCWILLSHMTRERSSLFFSNKKRHILLWIYYCSLVDCQVTEGPQAAINDRAAFLRTRQAVK